MTSISGVALKKHPAPLELYSGLSYSGITSYRLVYSEFMILISKSINEVKFGLLVDCMIKYFKRFSLNHNFNDLKCAKHVVRAFSHADAINLSNMPGFLIRNDNDVLWSGIRRLIDVPLHIIPLISYQMCPYVSSLSVRTTTRQRPVWREDRGVKYLSITWSFPYAENEMDEDIRFVQSWVYYQPLNRLALIFDDCFLWNDVKKCPLAPKITINDEFCVSIKCWNHCVPAVRDFAEQLFWNTDEVQWVTRRSTARYVL